MNLKSLGWPSDLHQDIDVSSLARIVAVHRSHLRAATANKMINLHLSGSTDIIPVVGDWVMVTPEFEDEQGEPAAIVKEVIPRTSELSRWTDSGEQAMAANLNTAFVVTSVNKDFNLNRLHRYLVLAQRGGVQPVVLLSKADLIEKVNDLVKEVETKLQVKVIATSIHSRQGIDEVLSLMPEGSTSVFVGSSGVGKSSLVNLIMGDDVQVTQEARSDDDKGRHTTTSRELFMVPGHGIIIDTPGIREVQVFGEEEDVLSVFPFIESLSQGCKFKNCSHETEPGCAVQLALESGELEPKEWESFQKLQKEVAHISRKQDKAEMANSKKKWKQLSKMIKNMKKMES